MSAINLLEVCHDAERRTGNPSGAREVMEKTAELDIEILWELSSALLFAASTFKSRGRISLADAIALALAQNLGASIVTADHHEFDPIERLGLVHFEWIR
jgi:predicted nucleic acid-binding protein